MARASDDRLMTVCAYLAVLAGAIIVLTMQLPQPETTTASILNGARFVVAVAAAIFGFIVWFERRFPLDDIPAEVRADSVR